MAKLTVIHRGIKSANIIFKDARGNLEDAVEAYYKEQGLEHGFKKVQESDVSAVLGPQRAVSDDLADPPCTSARQFAPCTDANNRSLKKTKEYSGILEVLEDRQFITKSKRGGFIYGDSGMKVMSFLGAILKKHYNHEESACDYDSRQAPIPRGHNSPQASGGNKKPRLDKSIYGANAHLLCGNPEVSKAIEALPKEVRDSIRQIDDNGGYYSLAEEENIWELYQKHVLKETDSFQLLWVSNPHRKLRTNTAEIDEELPGKCIADARNLQNLKVPLGEMTLDLLHCLKKYHRNNSYMMPVTIAAEYEDDRFGDCTLKAFPYVRNNTILHYITCMDPSVPYPPRYKEALKEVITLEPGSMCLSVDEHIKNKNLDQVCAYMIGRTHRFFLDLGVDAKILKYWTTSSSSVSVVINLPISGGTSIFQIDKINDLAEQKDFELPNPSTPVPITVTKLKFNSPLMRKKLGGEMAGNLIKTLKALDDEKKQSVYKQLQDEGLVTKDMPCELQASMITGMERTDTKSIKCKPAIVETHCSLGQLLAAIYELWFMKGTFAFPFSLAPFKVYMFPEGNPPNRADALSAAYSVYSELQGICHLIKFNTSARTNSYHLKRSQQYDIPYAVCVSYSGDVRLFKGDSQARFFTKDVSGQLIRELCGCHTPSVFDPSILKVEQAVDSFQVGLKIEPGNKELNDAYQEAVRGLPSDPDNS